MTSPTVKGFTIMELLVVVTIVGLIAAFSIPNYSRSVLKAREREMVAKLETVHGANLVYQAQNGSFYAVHGAVRDLDTLNSALNINLAFTDTKETWTYGGDGSAYGFTVQFVDGLNGFALTINEGPISATNPYCSSGIDDCPTIDCPFITCPNAE